MYIKFLFFLFLASWSYLAVTPPFILDALYITTVQYEHIYACLKLILTLLALVLPVAQWLEHPNYNLGGREFDSHLELGIFFFLVLEFSVVQITLYL